MIPIKINGKKLMIPSKWEDLKFKEYIEYINIEKKDIYSVLEIFTGIDRKSWEQSNNIKGFYVIIDALEFIAKKPKKKYKCPPAVEVDGKIYKVPKDLDTHTVKQYEDMRAVLQTEMKNKKNFEVESYPKIAAIYMSKEIFGEYSIKNWKKTIPIIENLPYFEVVGIGNFFLMNLIGLRIGTNPFARKLSILMRSWMQGLKKLMLGDSSTPSTIYHQGFGVKEK
jgi:hypothetical protein